MKRSRFTSLRRGSGIGEGEIPLVWFSEVQWDFLSTRKQRLLQRFPENWRILFIEPYAFGRKHHWMPVRRGGVTVVTVPFLKSVQGRFAGLFDNVMLRGLVAGTGRFWMQWWVLLLGFGSSGRIIGLSNIHWGKVAASMPCRVRFYDANDDHLGFTGSPLWLREFLRTYLDACDLLFFVTPELLVSLQPKPGIRCIELGNGVEFDHFARPAGHVPPAIAGLRKPLLGYAGAMDWLDAGLVEATARAWPECTIVLIGPAYAADWWERQRALQALPNVHYLGKVDYREFPAYVQCLDLALMPLERSALKRVSHPNKLYEYTAAGVPVLAIDYCSTVAAARRVITVASTPGEFTRLVPEALADTAREARQAFARAHSWDTLAGIMIRELLACLQGGCR